MDNLFVLSLLKAVPQGTVCIALYPVVNNQLKYVSKLKAHFVKMVNIFRNFYGIRDFTFAMHSYDNEDNFPL